MSFLRKLNRWGVFAGAQPVTFFNDLFNGTNGTDITAHAPDQGGTWTRLTSYANANRISLLDGSLLCVDALGGTLLYYNDVTPPSANYYVECVFGFTTASQDSYPGIVGRQATGADTNYYARYASGGGGNVWQLFRAVAGAYTQLGSSVGQAYPSSTDVTVRLTMNGDQISVQRNGTTIIGPITDGNVTAAGRPGIRWNGNPSSIFKRSITAAAL